MVLPTYQCRTKTKLEFRFCLVYSFEYLIHFVYCWSPTSPGHVTLIFYIDMLINFNCHLTSDRLCIYLQFVKYCSCCNQYLSSTDKYQFTQRNCRMPTPPFCYCFPAVSACYSASAYVHHVMLQCQLSSTTLQQSYNCIMSKFNIWKMYPISHPHSY